MANTEQRATKKTVGEKPNRLTHSWANAFASICRAGQRIISGYAAEGLYEVLEFESTLELRDKRGERALVCKYEKVRYLQDNIVAFQDEAWGDGDILLNYRCSPGVAVDWYRPGKKTYVLISLREVKNRGDLDEFRMTWEMLHSFLRPTELWEAAINHPMRRFKIQVIFPQARPPLRTFLTEETTRKVLPLGKDAQRQLPDGRWLIVWETNRPRLRETYGLQWDW